MKSVLVKVTIFAGLLVLAVLTAGDWHRLDHAVFARLVVPAAAPHAGIRLVELLDLDPDDAQSVRFRQQLGEALQAVARRNPARVVIDIQLEAGRGPLHGVLQAFDALRAAKVPVFLAADPRAGPDTLAPEVYGHPAVTRVGHTRILRHGGLGVFKPSEEAGGGKSLDFLPMLLIDGIDAQALQGYRVFATPPLNTSEGVSVPFERLSASLEGDTVIVASSARECRAAGGNRPDDDQSLCRGKAGSYDWSGPDLLVWSLTDLLERDQPRIRRPVQEGGWILFAALAAAALTLTAHAMTFRWAGRNWSPTLLSRWLPGVTVGAAVAVVVVLALLEALLLHLGWWLPPTFSLIAALLTVCLCHWHLRQRIVTLLANFERRGADNAIAGEYDVFISYAHAAGNGAWVEREIVEPLRALRLSDGRPLRIFFDRNDIRVGERWFSRINLSILGSRCFLCVWSDDYLERDYCRWELEFAYPRAARPDFLFLPVSRLPAAMLASPAYAQYLQARQFVDASARPDFFAEVRDAVARHLGLTSTAAAAPPAVA